MELTDEERRALAEAFHSWDHAPREMKDPMDSECAEFVADFEPLIADLFAARLAAVEALADDPARTFIVPTPGTKFDRTRVVRVRDIRAAVRAEPSETTRSC